MQSSTCGTTAVGNEWETSGYELCLGFTQLLPNRWDVVYFTFISSLNSSALCSQFVLFISGTTTCTQLLTAGLMGSISPVLSVGQIQTVAGAGFGKLQLFAKPRWLDELKTHELKRRKHDVSAARCLFLLNCFGSCWCTSSEPTEPILISI